MGAPTNQRPEKRIAMFAYPDANSLDVVGPLQVFASASRYMQNFMPAGDPGPRITYITEIIGPEAGPLRMSPGFEVVASRALADAPEDLDTLLIAGGDGNSAMAANPEILETLRQLAPGVRRVGSICTGAFILAAAGMLDDRRATTHWRYCSDLAQTHSSVDVEPDALHIRDGDIYTSAGVTAGMDLALALVEEDCGRRIALATAREIVAFLKRPGGQSQFSVHLEAQSGETTPMQDLQDWILGNVAEDLSVEALAAKVAMSPRNFARVFTRETGSTPAKFVERARVDAARRALEDSTDPLPAIAEQCGFGHPETLRRVFQRHLKVAPQDYRQRFQAKPAALVT